MLKCLERDSENRYRTALEVAEALDRVRQGSPVRARPVSRLEKCGRWMRGNPLISGLTAAQTDLKIETDDLFGTLSDLVSQLPSLMSRKTYIEFISQMKIVTTSTPQALPKVSNNEQQHYHGLPLSSC